MNIPPRLSRLIGWIARCAAVALFSAAFCASAVAGDAGKNVVALTKAPPETTAHAVRKKQIYVITSGSAIPQPVERIATPIPTTAIPMTVIANRLGN
ncbi:MAG: hypothetical protein DLM52_00870 [Chthoniobacterales bacterium]|nr:MAG: hypothetical protein DLM52_00870 [Chthoniobacterales bacterium]